MFSFQHNTIIDDMAYPGIIENTFGSELNITNCLFEKNVYGDEKNMAVRIESNQVLSTDYQFLILFSLSAFLSILVMQSEALAR